MSEELEEYLQQARTLLEAGLPEDAAMYAGRVLEQEEMNYEAWMLNGIAAAGLERWDQALESLHRAQMLDTGASAPHYHMGMVYFMQGDNESGIRECNQAMDLGFDKPELYFNLGLVYETLGEYDSAVRYYTRATGKDPLNPYPYVRKAMVFLNQMKYEEGLEVLARLRQNCPDCFEGYHFAAAAYTAMGDYEGADQILDRAESLFEQDVDILTDRIKVLVAQERYEDAEKKIKAALEMTQEPLQKKQLILSRAKLTGLKGNVEESIVLMKEALACGEQADVDSEIRYLLINAFLPEGNYREILEQAGKLKELPETLPYALGAYYFAAFATAGLDPDQKAGAYKEAICYYRNLTIRKPSMIEAYLFRAICHKELEEFEKALELVDYVEKLSPSSPKLTLIRAGILKGMGREQEARELLDRPEMAVEPLAGYLMQ